MCSHGASRASWAHCLQVQTLQQPRPLCGAAATHSQLGTACVPTELALQLNSTTFPSHRTISGHGTLTRRIYTAKAALASNKNTTDNRYLEWRAVEKFLKFLNPSKRFNSWAIELHASLSLSRCMTCGASPNTTSLQNVVLVMLSSVRWVCVVCALWAFSEVVASASVTKQRLI